MKVATRFKIPVGTRTRTSASATIRNQSRKKCVSVTASIHKYVVPAASVVANIGFHYVVDTIIQKRPRVFSEWLCDYLIELGPIFVKIGQTVSTRKDFVSPELIESLQRLQDNVTPFSISMKSICDFIDAELQGPSKWTDEFDHIHPIPIAAASIAQVHVARLKNGLQVVVKLQRPNIREDFMKFEHGYTMIAKLVEKLPYNNFSQLHDTVTLLGECLSHVRDEIDFRNEIKNMYIMQKVFKDNEDVIVPRVFSKLSTERMIVMEYIPGSSISKYENMANEGEKLAKSLMVSFITGIQTYGVFHSDPHPGNMAITTDNKIVLYDYGLVTKLDPSILPLCKRALYSIYSYQIDEVITFMFKTNIIHLRRDPSLCDIKMLTDDEYVVLHQSMSYVIDYLMTVDVRSDSKRLLQDSFVMKGIKNNPFYLDSLSLLIVRTFISLEGSCKAMNPSFSYGEVLQDLVDVFASDVDFLFEQAELNMSRMSPIKVTNDLAKNISGTRVQAARLRTVVSDLEEMKYQNMLLTFACSFIVILMVFFDIV